MRKLKLFLASKISDFFVKRQNLDGFLPIFCYHRVLPDFIEAVNDPIYTLLPDQFESQMAFLAEEGFNSLSLQEVADIARGSYPLKKRSVLITFDDGYADNYYIAWPIAKKYGIKLNLFICTSNIGTIDPILFYNDGYLTTKVSEPAEGGISKVQSHIHDFPHLWRPLNWQELHTMKDAGVQIGFHSHGHRRLSLLTQEELVNDITTGLEVFETKLGYRPQFCAFPYGGYDSYNPSILAVLRRFGLDFNFATHLGRAKLPSAQPIFPRFLVYQQDNLAIFQRKIFGGYDWLRPIQWLEHLTRVVTKN
jgi:peptidoglycan/xylan/chitin deacetylase (PgdA/CDA1 family)